MYSCPFCYRKFGDLEDVSQHCADAHSFVDNSVEKTLAERGSIYGNFMQEAVLVENIKKALRAHPKWDYLPPDAKLSLEMITLKQVRAINDYTHADNWHDIGGYAKLVEDRLTQEKNREEK